MPYLLFAVYVLETPLGFYESDDDSTVSAEREKILKRYEQLKGQHHSFADASRIARAEWLGEWLAKQLEGGA